MHCDFQIINISMTKYSDDENTDYYLEFCARQQKLHTANCIAWQSPASVCLALALSCCASA